jgi:hypothetical protein
MWGLAPYHVQHTLKGGGEGHDDKDAELGLLGMRPNDPVVQRVPDPVEHIVLGQ